MNQRSEALNPQAITDLEMKHQERLQKKIRLSQAIAFCKEHPEAIKKDVAITYKVSENSLRLKLFRMKRSESQKLIEVQPKVERRGRKKKNLNVGLELENRPNDDMKEGQGQIISESLRQLDEFDTIKRELEASKRLTRRLKHRLAHLRKEKKAMKEEFLGATAEAKRLKIDFEESLEREKKLKLEVKKEQEETQKIHNTTGVLANIALAHNKYFEEKAQKNGGVICPATKEPYRLENDQIILKALECGHYLSKGGWEGMANSPYGAFCPSCRCEGKYFHAWAETMMANQKFLMDNYMKHQSSFESVLKLNSISVEEASARNPQQELTQRLNQLQMEVDYPQEILDELLAILPNPSVNNFHQFLVNREKTIPRANDWSQVSAETFASKKKLWTPPVSQTEMEATLHANEVSQLMHHFNLTLEEAERRISRMRRSIPIIVQGSQLPRNEITLAPGSNILDVIAPQRQQNQ